MVTPQGTLGESIRHFHILLPVEIQVGRFAAYDHGGRIDPFNWNILVTIGVQYPARVLKVRVDD